MSFTMRTLVAVPIAALTLITGCGSSSSSSNAGPFGLGASGSLSASLSQSSSSSGSQSAGGGGNACAALSASDAQDILGEAATAQPGGGSTCSYASSTGSSLTLSVSPYGGGGNAQLALNSAAGALKGQTGVQTNVSGIGDGAVEVTGGTVGITGIIFVKGDKLAILAGLKLSGQIDTGKLEALAKKVADQL